jgi:K+-sensing histidine kinase KdpD
MPQISDSKNTIPLGYDTDKSIANSDYLFEFVSLMVHDLQGPVASMKTLVKLLETSRYDPSSKLHKELAASAYNALQRSESIIHDLIDVARANKIGLPYYPDKYDLNDIILNSIDVISGSALDYNISLVKILSKDKIIVTVDRNLLSRVMDNLLFNALKHSSGGSSVYIATEVYGDDIMVNVRDEGTGFGGINPDDLFDKYRQVALRSEGKFRGAGLGLHFCRLAINAMGGNIWAKNNPDRGASFGFALKITKG